MRHMEPMVPGNWPFPYWTGFFDDMSELERALRKVGRLIAIGGEYRPHSFRSTALLMRVPPEDWRKAVQQWAHGARAIIYEPGPTQGVVEELQLIADWQLQKKTIILIRSPGNSDLGYLSRTRAAVASAGFELPSLQRTAGVAFLLPEQFSSVSAVTHEIKERWKWKHLRKAILPCLPSGRSWVPLADMLVYQGSASANIRDLCESQTGRTEDQSSETRLG